MTHGGECGLTDSFILNTQDSIAPFDLEHGDGGVLLILLAWDHHAPFFFFSKTDQNEQNDGTRPLNGGGNGRASQL